MNVAAITILGSEKRLSSASEMKPGPLIGCNGYSDPELTAGLRRTTPRRRKAELRVLQCRAHALAAFLDLGLRKADEIECRQSIGEMHLDAHQRACMPDKAREWTMATVTN